MTKTMETLRLLGYALMDRLLDKMKLVPGGSGGPRPRITDEEDRDAPEYGLVRVTSKSFRVI